MDRKIRSRENGGNTEKNTLKRTFAIEKPVTEGKPKGYKILDKIKATNDEHVIQGIFLQTFPPPGSSRSPKLLPDRVILPWMTGTLSMRMSLDSSGGELAIAHPFHPLRPRVGGGVGVRSEPESEPSSSPSLAFFSSPSPSPSSPAEPVSESGRATQPFQPFFTGPAAIGNDVDTEVSDVAVEMGLGPSLAGALLRAFLAGRRSRSLVEVDWGEESIGRLLLLLVIARVAAEDVDDDLVSGAGTVTLEVLASTFAGAGAGGLMMTSLLRLDGALGLEVLAEVAPDLVPCSDCRRFMVGFADFEEPEAPFFSISFLTIATATIDMMGDPNP